MCEIDGFFDVAQEGPGLGVGFEVEAGNISAAVEGAEAAAGLAVAGEFGHPDGPLLLSPVMSLTV
jgi:hypothetical protein